MELPKPHPKPVRLFYFYSGIVATLAYRVIIVLNNFDPVWVDVAWYIGTIGFIVYFIHRYQIANIRSRLIVERELEEKIKAQQPLDADDRAALGYILGTLTTSKEKWNNIVIFVTSGLALAIGIYLDFLS